VEVDSTTNTPTCFDREQPAKDPAATCVILHNKYARHECISWLRFAASRDNRWASPFWAAYRCPFDAQLMERQSTSKLLQSTAKLSMEKQSESRMDPKLQPRPKELPAVATLRCVQAKLGGLRFSPQFPSATSGVRGPIDKTDRQGPTAEWAGGCPCASAGRALLQDEMQAVERFPVYT